MNKRLHRHLNRSLLCGVSKIGPELAVAVMACALYVLGQIFFLLFFVFSLTCRMLLKQGAGSGERGAGNGERKSGNELSAETSTEIQNGGPKNEREKEEYKERNSIVPWLKSGGHEIANQTHILRLRFEQVVGFFDIQPVSFTI